MADSTRIELSLGDRAVFARAAALASRLRDEARKINPQFGFDNAAADRALYAVEHEARYLSDLTQIRTEEIDF